MKSIEEIIKAAITRHLVKHEPINDTRDRVDILVEEVKNEIHEFYQKNVIEPLVKEFTTPKEIRRVSVEFDVEVEKIGNVFSCEILGTGICIIAKDEAKIAERVKKSMIAYIAHSRDELKNQESKNSEDSEDGHY